MRAIALEVVDGLSLVESAFTSGKSADTNDNVYNYTRVLCHYGALVTEFSLKQSLQL